MVEGRMKRMRIDGRTKVLSLEIWILSIIVGIFGSVYLIP